MSAKACREYHGKRLLSKHLSLKGHSLDSRSALVTSSTDFDLLVDSEPWLISTELVVKPDQLIKRRGKCGLVGVKMGLEEVKGWIYERMGKGISIEGKKTIDSDSALHSRSLFRFLRRVFSQGCDREFRF